MPSGGTSIALGSSKSRRVSMPMCWIGLNPGRGYQSIELNAILPPRDAADLGEVGQITGFARAERSASASRWPPSALVGLPATTVISDWRATPKRCASRSRDFTIHTGKIHVHRLASFPNTSSFAQIECSVMSHQHRTSDQVSWLSIQPRLLFARPPHRDKPHTLAPPEGSEGKTQRRYSPRSL